MLKKTQESEIRTAALGMLDTYSRNLKDGYSKVFSE